MHPLYTKHSVMTSSVMNAEEFLSEVKEGRRDFTGLVMESATLGAEVREYFATEAPTLKCNPLILSRAHLGGIVARDMQIPFLQAEGADFSEADLTGSCFDFAFMRGVGLERAKLESVSMKFADMHAAFLHHAICDNAMMRGAYLHGAIAENASFVGADFEQAALDRIFARRACFDNANMAVADLRYANLQLASFERSCVDGADIFRALIIEAAITEEQLEVAKNSKYAYR
ncbi:MAG: pentapeptide repeat-containing protein [Patescibacteria group bacterium]